MGWTDRRVAQNLMATATISFSGVDDIGLVNHITGIISADMTVDMRKVSFETNEGSFEGRVEVVVNDTEHLGELIDRLRQVPGVSTVDRLRIDRARISVDNPSEFPGMHLSRAYFCSLDDRPMKVDVLLGLQWGDEGKGKIVDVLTPQYDIIARFPGWA